MSKRPYTTESVERALTVHFHRRWSKPPTDTGVVRYRITAGTPLPDLTLREAWLVVVGAAEAKRLAAAS